MISEEQSFVTKKLWLEYEPYIRKLCAYKLKSLPEHTDDCVQEVFLDLSRAYEKGQVPEYPKAWLTKVANNKINDIYKKAKKDSERLVSLDEEFTRISCSVSVFDETFSVSDEEILLLKKKIIARLDDSDRQLLSDRFSLKKSTVQIAQEYGTTENNIYQRIFRLKMKTKMLIEKELFEQK